MHKVQLHPRARPIVVLEPEEQDALKQICKAVVAAGEALLEMARAAWKSLKDFARTHSGLFRRKVQLHPGAAAIDVPLFWRIEFTKGDADVRRGERSAG